MRKYIIMAALVILGIDYRISFVQHRLLYNGPHLNARILRLLP